MRVLVTVGAASGTLLALTIFHHPEWALLVIMALAGLAGLAAAMVLLPRRVVELVFFAFFLLISIPIDKYFLYRPHAGGWAGLRISVADICLGLLLAFCIVGWVLGRLNNRVPRVVLILYGLLLMQYGLSWLGAYDRALATFEIAAAIHALVTCTVLAALLRREHIEPFLVALAVTVLLHTALAGAQTVTGRPIGQDWFGGESGVVVESLVTGQSRLRPTGLFDHPIVFANFLMMSAPLLAVGGLVSRNPWLKLGLAIALVASLSGLAMTLSRGAWISSVFAGAVLLALGVHRRILTFQLARRAVVAAGVLLLPVAVYFAPAVLERLTQSQSGNLEVRFELNEIALRMIADRPMIGVGLNNFIEVMERYDPKDVMSYFPATVHNLYLLECSEAGIPALLLFLGVFAAVLAYGVRGLTRMQDTALQWLVIAFIAGLSGLLLSQLADFSHRMEPLRSMVWMHIGLLFGLLALDRGAETDRART